MDKETARNRLIDLLNEAEIITHPDTNSTFSAYQFILDGKFDIWMNARNGKIIATGLLMNAI